MLHIQRIVKTRSVEGMLHSLSDKARRRRSSRPMDTNLFLVFLLMLTWSENGQGVSGRSVGQGEDKKTAYIPPEILQHPPEEVAYKEGEPASLACRATGDPAPAYRWEKDGARIEESEHPGISFSTEDGGYDLHIDSGKEDYDGYYQCFATNSYGTAVSTRSRLLKAVLDTFESKDVQVRPVDVGRPLILRCNPPKSYPSAVVYWGEKGSTEKVRPIESNERLTLDYSGNLYFAHVNASDARNGRRYVCLASNTRIRTHVQGDDNIIEPNKVDLVAVAPKLVWYSADPTGHVVGIKGQAVKMKCIFSGYPTPKVSFTRVGGVMERHMTMPDDSYGQELVIYPVSPEDEGQYRCTATNSATETPVSRDFRLTVESAPFWQTEPPQNQNIDEGEGAEFSCLVEGSPTPTVSWLANGKPVKDLPANPRRSVTEYSMTYTNVTSEDAQVIQCNVTNKHGGLFSNAYLTVRSDPPTFLERPVEHTKVVEGGEVILSCRGTGAPRPFVGWYRGEYKKELVEPLTERSELQYQILAASESDEGEYHCQLSNKYGSDDSTAHVSVLKKISIVTGSQQNESAVAGSDVTLTCDVIADRHDNVKVTWWHGYRNLLDEAEGGWYKIREEEGGRHLLTLTDTVVEDTGEYMCRVKSDEDEAEIPIHLIIRDKPDPPVGFKFSDCNSDATELSWQPGSDNNERIIAYDIKHVTSLDEPGDEPSQYSLWVGNLNLTVDLEPYRNHSFYIYARNDLGNSATVEAGPVGEGLCTSPSATPSVNPKGVCTELLGPDQLVVTWEPIPRDQLNGPGFHYVVSFTRLDETDAVEEVRLVSDPTEGRLVVSGLPSFKPFSVFVQASNEVGVAKDAPPKYSMRSGEAAPLLAAQNFKLVEEAMNSSGSLFEWDPIDETRDEEIRGYFKGYQVRYWKKDKPEDVRSTDLILRPDPDLCPLTPEASEPGALLRRKRRRREAESDVVGAGGGEKVEIYITNLWSSSEVEAGVAVLNGAGGGTISDVITFVTPAGPPEAVQLLAANEVGSFHMKLAWLPPPVGQGDEINGYLVTYKSVLENGALSNSEHIKVMLPPVSQSSRLTGLQPDTLYRITVCADTRYGCGQPSYVEQQTKPDSPPDKPEIVYMAAGETWANVSFSRTEGGVAENNPSSEFYVEFRKTDSTTNTWLRSSTEQDLTWINVTELIPGAEYQMRVVAANERHVTPSEIKPYRVVLPEPIKTGSASSPIWLIILLIVLLLIILIIVIACIIYRRRGGSYPVFAKEKEKEKDPQKKLAADEKPFSEYTQDSREPLTGVGASSAPSLPPTSGSNGSLNSKSGIGDTDMDSLLGSLGEYEDSEETKFNEDGSFIGQYGGPVRRLESVETGYVEAEGPRPGQGGPPPKAHNTFV